jgi:bifunctional UDP-N-acetylglucosamine pyrophosphorylase/glucosamine-1-phosphate N-acetyltransferase
MKKGDNTRIVILAGGKGNRMGGNLPKVLMRVHGKSMIKHLLESVEKSGIDNNPIIVVGYKRELVMEELGKENKQYHYIYQEHQLGTGHAVLCTKDACGNVQNIIVLYGDHPFTSTATIKKISEKHSSSGKKITMATVKLKDFKDWRICFENFSRIIRDGNGKIIKDVQFKDANEGERKVTEVNPCYYCFDALWLWENLKTLNKDNAQKEYYLTDLIKIATENGMELESIDIEAKEALGANTKEELEILEKINK